MQPFTIFHFISAQHFARFPGFRENICWTAAYPGGIVDEHHYSWPNFALTFIFKSALVFGNQSFLDVLESLKTNFSFKLNIHKTRWAGQKSPGSSFYDVIWGWGVWSQVNCQKLCKVYQKILELDIEFWNICRKFFFVWITKF